MKKHIIPIGFVIFLLFMLSGVKANADSLILDLGARSDHLVKGNFNEKNHNWLGLGYRFLEKDTYSVETKYVRFVNSYFDKTEFYALTGIYTPLKYKKVKLGLSGSIGYQKGYCVSINGTQKCSEEEKINGDNTSILLMYSLYTEIDNIIINYTYIPGAVQAVSVGIKVIEW